MEKVKIKEKIRRRTDKKTKSVIESCSEIAAVYGFEIYLVGGIVRDILLNRELKDVDITVVGDAKKFAEIIECYLPVKMVKYQENLPTARVLFKNGVEIDFASSRSEVYKNPGELPVIVETGCSLKKDILRRDFTVNAMAVSLNSDNLFELIDFTGGYEDLKKKELKVLHKKSFYDDPSRMIRGLKFALRLGFHLSGDTLKLQNEYLENPSENIPLERVKNEMKELLSMNKIGCFDEFINQKLYKIFLPDFQIEVDGVGIRNALFDFDIKDEDIPLLYFLPLFYAQNPPAKMNLTSRELQIIKDMRDFKDNHKTFDDNYSIFEYFHKKDYLSAVFFGTFKNMKIIKRYFSVLKDKKLEITGQDLKNIGICEGKIFAEIQKAVMKEKLNNGLQNKTEELEFVRKYLKTKELRK